MASPQGSGSQGPEIKESFSAEKLPVTGSQGSSCMPFKIQNLRQLRAQCLVFRAFRDGLVPKKLHLEIALGDDYPKEVMEKSSSTKKGGENNFMWNNKKEKFLISFLAECANNGEKYGTSFRKSVYIKAAQGVTDTFSELCTTTNVESRLKTMKKRYTSIKNLRGMSGWGWDEKQKMVVVDRNDALDFIERNPYAKDLLNVPIDQYEELKIIFGEDQATGSFAKSVAGLPSDANEETRANQGATFEERAIDSSGSMSERSKRSRPSDEIYNMLFSKLDGLTSEVSRLTDCLISTDQEFFDHVYQEVFKTEGFDDRVLCKAFEFLTEHPLSGRQFIAKRPDLRKHWMSDFISTLD